jgi:hypothetical protein
MKASIESDGHGGGLTAKGSHLFQLERTCKIQVSMPALNTMKTEAMSRERGHSREPRFSLIDRPSNPRVASASP